MILTLERQLTAITDHARRLADEVRDALDAPVPGCPEWDVAALLEHLINVHWFWATDVEERRTTHDDGPRRPAPARAVLVESFLAGAQHLVDVLAQTDPSTTVWTWAPSHQTAAFVSRHQVQEMVVHHFDGAAAVGARFSVDVDVAVDCVDEFLTFSVSNADDLAPDTAAPLGGRFALACTDADASWTLADGPVPRTVAATPGVSLGVATIAAPATDLLLWLYQRADVDESAVPAELLARFRALTFTD